MKYIVLVMLSSLMIFDKSKCQNADYLLASRNGIGPFKIGMHEDSVEKILGSPLHDYLVEDTAKKLNASALDSANQSPTQSFKCNYKGIDLWFTFLKPKWIKNSVFELVGVVGTSMKIKSKDGITVSLTEDSLKKLCKVHNLEAFHYYDATQNNYLVSQKGDNGSNVLWVSLKDNVVVGLAAVNMIGD